MRISGSIWILFLALGLSSCSGTAELDPGVLGGPCRDDGTCDGDLVCNADLICDRKPEEDPCEEVSCGEHGSCAVSDGAAICICEAGYHAQDLACVADHDPCAEVSCSGHGICAILDGSAVCICDKGYHADDLTCIEDADPCDGVSCSDHGSCSVIDDMPVCICDAGYDGDNCETDIDDCATATCLNGASCVDGVNSYTCECASGFTGDHCEINIDDCAADPCLNGGACADGVDSYVCHCAPGYEGTNCETDIDECALEGSMCFNGGTCVDGVNSYSCDCVNGYSGYLCERCEGFLYEGVCHRLRIFVSGWQGSPDFGGPAAADAICNSDANRPDDTKSYKALLGQSGLRELGTDWPLIPSTIYYRSDGTTVIDTTNADAIFVFDLLNSIWETNPECWTGLDANFNVTATCDNWTNPSSGTTHVGVANRINSGAIDAYAQFCTRTNPHLYCVETPCGLDEAWDGTGCNWIDDCDPNPCLNGGACTDGVNSFTCECPAGFEGDTCEINIDDCVDDPCLNGGTCVDGVNSYTCECQGPWSGDNCQICDGDFFAGECRRLRIFVSYTSLMGNLGGVAGADHLCNIDSNRPDPSRTYKALLVSQNDRLPYIDWPLQASTSYYRPDQQTRISLTDNDYGELDFPLENAISTTEQYVWTGGVSFSPHTDCEQWTSSVAYGTDGLSNQTDYRAFYFNSYYCTVFHSLYCVEMICDQGFHYDTGSDSCVAD